MADGKISSSGAQHVQFYRKYLLRKHLLRHAVGGAAYVPFIGDGDLAVDLYGDRQVYGADLDEKRCQVAASRLDRADVVVADCDGWPFKGLLDPLAVADFDAYVNPYLGFRAFWLGAQKQDTMVLFFTDGIKQAIVRSGVWSKFDGSKETIGHEDLLRKRALFNAYWAKFVYPEFVEFIRPWRVIDRMRYLRASMCYWGAAIELPKG